MFKNFLKITWRSLTKNRMSAFINIGGLAMGMAVAVLIALWVQDEIRYDRYHAHYDKVGQLHIHSKVNGTIYTGRAMPMPIAEELRAQYGSHFKHVALSSWESGNVLSYGDNHVSQTGVFTEKDGPALFSVKMLKGTSNALSDPQSILLSESAAEALFGKEEPIGKQIKIFSRDLVTVAGVYQDFPYNATLRDVNYMASWSLYLNSEPWLKNAQTQWDNNSFQVYVQVSDRASFDEVNAAIAKVKEKNLGEEDKIFEHKIFVHPMKDWHLRSNWKNGVLADGEDQYVWMFSAIGLFVLLLACINFMNLSTAKSEKRAKEVGIRKTVGSERRMLVFQFLYESVVVALIAFALSFLLVAAALPWFNDVADKKMTLPWNSPIFWLSGLIFSIFTGLVAGSYPAFYLSSFNPVKVLKGTFRAGKMAAIPRKALVVVQFTVSIFLIIGTSVVYKQILHTKDRPVGYDRAGLIMIEMLTPDFYGKYDVLNDQLKKEGLITEMSESSSPMDAVQSNSGGFNWEGKDPALVAGFGTIWVTHDYGKTIGWEVVNGRDFSRSFGTDSSGIILNESAVKFMNLTDDPVGKAITWGAYNLHVVGVVKDVVMSSPFSPVKPAIYLLSYENVNFINLRLQPDRPLAGSLAGIERVFKDIIPNAPFDYKFADEAYAAKFEMEQRVGKLALLFTLLAIAISCLGLFGLAAFTAEQRVKEIGIRKIVGASVYSLWRLLSVDFLVLTFLSAVLAMPIAYFLMQNWLAKYTYRIEITWEIFVLALLVSIFITLVTVSYQALKAATINPVRSLRSE